MARNAQQHLTTSTICRLLRRTEQEKILVALPGLEPGLSALRGRRVNQLHHNAKSHPQEDVFSSASTKYSKPSARTQNAASRFWNIRAKHEPGGSRGLQASESRGK